MRVKIISDGTRSGTRIVDAETNKPLDGLHVYGIQWTVAPEHGAQPICLLTCRSTEVEIEGNAGVDHLEQEPDAA
jgi:hypothetical protein